MIKKYDKFQDIIDTMDEAGYDHKKGYQWTLNNLKRRREGNIVEKGKNLFLEQ